jgi:hypothetical protein
VATTTPSLCGYDWADNTGIPGGIPDATWTQSGSTINSTGSDQTSTINAALASCGTNHYVLLGGTPASPQTFQVGGSLNVPSNCVLRGGGANATILNYESGFSSSPYSMVRLGSASAPNFNDSGSLVAVSSAAAGATSITVSSASGFAAGQFVIIAQKQDGKIVSYAGTEGNCTWCDAGEGEAVGGSSAHLYSQGQIDKIVSISGTTLNLEMPLMVSYASSPYATPLTMNVNSGVENLQIYQNYTNSSPPSQIYMETCAYCWVNGVENNYADGDHVDVDWSYRGEIQNSYFSNDFLHQAGCCDSDVDLRYKTTGMRVENNILERLHTSLMLEWGAAGNVLAYNYSTGDFDAGSYNYAIQDIAFHGAHPQFNLFEGNVSNTLGQDGIWGSSANNTAFRNWAWGAGMVCNPLSGRGTVTCSGSNGWITSQGDKAFDVNYPESNYFMIGNIEGSSQQSGEGTGYALATAVCGSSVPSGAPCGSSSRIYQGAYYNETFGYGTTGDGGGGTSDGLLPWNTSFIHGEYGTVNNSVTWVSGYTHTLPASFYLSASPNWWSSTIPWPAIGPDVSGGTGPGGHVYSTTAANPAMNCYYNLMGGVLGGAGSPYSFSAAACYPGGSNTAPAAPTGLAAVVN